MAANSRFAIALHTAAVLASKPGELVCSDYIAKSVKTNPVVIRRVLCCLCGAGLVECQKGKSGGARLSRAPEKISLLDIYEAAECGGVFAENPKPENKKCRVSCHMKKAIHKVFIEAETALKKSLRSQTLAQVLSE